MNTYELVDPLTPDDLRALRTVHDEWVAPRELRLGRFAKGVRVRAVRTNACRYPRTGDWYLSGAIPQAYRARGPINSLRWIVKLVLARHVSDWDLIE